MQRQVWLIPIADERVGVQVKLWDPLRTRAIPERFWGSDSYEEALYQLYSHLPLPFTLKDNVSAIVAIWPFNHTSDKHKFHCLVLLKANC